MEANEYQLEAKRTDRINWEHEHGPDIALLGIIGEFGSLASVVKKHQRDKEAYSNFREHFLEELGDLLWYVSTAASRLNIKLAPWPTPLNTSKTIFEGIYQLQILISNLTDHKNFLSSPESSTNQNLASIIQEIIETLQDLAHLMNSSLTSIARSGNDKNLAYWSNFNDLPARKFDKNFPDYEQLPRKFEIDFMSIDNQSALIIRMNGLAIGDRLTDNSYQDDGYRFHDIFHIAGAATLGWSPVFRRMLNLKRKSDPRIDEIEDGARAAIIEEAVINHIYDYARPNFLEGVKRVDLDLIKRIQDLVRGYEVAECEPWEWQDCILKGYELFRILKSKKGGRIAVDAEERTLEFLGLEED